jgi:hypothetical protein
MSELATWVPDGDPCPRHPTEASRLCHFPSIGLYSQCRLCRDEFLAWRWANMNERSTLPLAPIDEPVEEQLRLLEPR